MRKRQFLGAAGSVLTASAASVALAPAIASPVTTRKTPAMSGPVLLTVTGDVTAINRGPIDHALDQMMHKQKLEFDRAHAFDFAALVALPATDIHPTLEYDGKRHALRGPLLADVLKAAGADPLADNVVLRAIDGYAVMLAREDLRKYRFIIATHLDGKPLALGGLGPLWAVYEADRYPELAERPLPERFGLCPWGLYHIAVRRTA